MGAVMAGGLKSYGADSGSLPRCPNCQVSMTWQRAITIADDPITVERHYGCPQCARVEKQRYACEAS